MSRRARRFVPRDEHWLTPCHSASDTIGMGGTYGREKDG